MTDLNSRLYILRGILTLIALVWCVMSYLNLSSEAREFKRQGYNGEIALLYTQKMRHRVGTFIVLIMIGAGAITQRHWSDRVASFAFLGVTLWTLFKSARDKRSLEVMVATHIKRKKDK